MKKSKLTFTLLVILLCTHYTAKAQDSKLENQFKRLNLNYNFDQQGNRYKLVFDVGEGRTQLVFVNAKTYDVGGEKVREIFSIAAKTQNRTDFSQRTLFTLLEKNFDYKIGGWQIHGGEPPYLLQFAIRVPEYVQDDYLLELFSQAAREADRVEKELTGGDDY